MKTLTLEPCPMCGDDPYIFYHPEEDPNKIQVKVQCECGLTMTHWIGIIEDRWNRRKAAALQAENAELRDIVKEYVALDGNTQGTGLLRKAVLALKAYDL